MRNDIVTWNLSQIWIKPYKTLTSSFGQEAFYMSVQTLTTVGFGDVYPATQGGRAFAKLGEKGQRCVGGSNWEAMKLSHHVFWYNNKL